MDNKKMRLSFYLLPKVIYIKYSKLMLFLLVLINALNLFFIISICKEFYIIIADPKSIIGILPILFLGIYADLDFFHAMMKKQFIEITDEHIRVKKLITNKTINWSEVKSLEELYSIKFHIKTGIMIRKRNTQKKHLFHDNIVINFNKYANVDIDEFYKVLLRKKVVTSALKYFFSFY